MLTLASNLGSIAKVIFRKLFYECAYKERRFIVAGGFELSTLDHHRSPHNKCNYRLLKLLKTCPSQHPHQPQVLATDSMKTSPKIKFLNRVQKGHAAFFCSA